MTTTEFWKLSKEERARVRAEIWEKFWANLHKPTQIVKTVPEPVKTLTDRLPPSFHIQSAEEIIDRHRNSIAKISHEPLIDEIRSFGQCEFERGIMYALKQLRK